MSFDDDGEVEFSGYTFAFFGGVADDQDSTFRNLRGFVSRCLLDAAVIRSIRC